MALLFKKKLLLAKSETTYGSDAGPTAADNAILTTGLSITPLQADMVDRNYDREMLGNSQSILVGSRVVVTFDIELAGSGTPGAEPAWGPLLKACGFVKATTTTTEVLYKPNGSPNSVSPGYESSATLYYHIEGILHKVTGARGTVSIMTNAGELPKMSFTMTGIYNAPASTTLPTATLTAWQQPLGVNKTNTTISRLATDYTGDEIVMQSFSLDVANDVQYRNLVNSESVLIVDRAPTASISFEAVPISPRDYMSYAYNSTDLKFRVTHGTVAGNIVNIDLTKVQLTDANYAESNGVLMINGNLRVLPTLGNDEIEITVS